MSFDNSLKYIPSSNKNDSKDMLEMTGELVVYVGKMGYAEAKTYVEALLKKKGWVGVYLESTHRSINKTGARIQKKLKNNNSKNRYAIKGAWHCFATAEATVATLQNPIPAVRPTKDFEELGQRQKYRRLTQVRESVTRTVEKFGFTSAQIKLKTPSATKITVSCEKGSSLWSESSSQQSTSQSQSSSQSSIESDEPSFKWKTGDDLSEIERTKAVIYVLDRYTVSTKAYHELSQIAFGLPRTHAVEKTQKQIARSFDIEPTPGKTVGAQMRLMGQLETDERVKSAEKSIMLKISGDGTRLTRKSNLVVMSYTIIEESGSFYKSSGNNAVGVGMASESYECVKECFQDLITEVNEIAKNPAIVVGGKELDVELFIGGDYKFLLMILGMKSATSDNSCIYCDITREQRQDPTFTGKKRKIDAKWSKQRGCKDDPILENVPIEHYCVDELHLLLRVTDRLEDGLFHSILDMDEKNGNTEIQSKLVSAMKGIGITLKFWMNKKNKVEWTSLMGNDKKRMLAKLPDHFDEFLPKNQVAPTRQLWKAFEELYMIMNRPELTPAEIDDFELKAIAWVYKLKKMNGCGYDWSYPVTPYIHIMVKHVPDVLRKYKTLRIFSGQGVEKKNDEFRKFFHSKINRRDACVDLLGVEKRLQMLQDGGFERQKRAYHQTED
ncbi:uncharacterized protein [Clytia hemisphaerica]|uniref:uncharacterized protein n=2 Tax=Clytia hemisphaerica TaxID=252671 RepID=UPI0034D3F5B1